MSIDKAIENAVASVRFEGMKVDDECIKWCKELLEHKITMEQYILRVKEKAGVTVK